MKTMSRGPKLPRITGLLASYKKSKISAPANRGPRQSGAKAGYIFTHKQALEDALILAQSGYCCITLA